MARMTFTGWDIVTFSDFNGKEAAEIYMRRAVSTPAFSIEMGASMISQKVTDVRRALKRESKHAYEESYFLND